MPHPPAIQAWMDLFATLPPGQRLEVARVYAPNVRFRDPLHTVSGRDDLDAYFLRLNKGLSEGGFVFHEVICQDDVAWIHWTMHLVLAMGPRRPLAIEGASRLVHRDGLVVEQLDLFDAGAAIYEQVPGLGALVRFVKRRV